MIIEPKAKGFICITAHPTGCAANVSRQIESVKSKCGAFESGKDIKNVLVIGSTTGYGLSSAICASFGYGAKVLGIGFERNAQKGRTASAGFYNAAEYMRKADDQGLWAKTIMGDAFSNQVKEMACSIIKEQMGMLDLIIYSLAAPVRVHPDTGERFQSVLKPVGSAYASKNINLQGSTITNIEIQPATEQEINDTIAVMGGDDWSRWIDLLHRKGLISSNAMTIAYSYIGPQLTHAIYKDGTIGMAKLDLKRTADTLTAKHKNDLNLNALISVNKALVTQASSSIPVVPLYISILYDVMKKKGTHEGCIEQMTRMFERINRGVAVTDTSGYIRMDDLEMDEAVQAEVRHRWELIDDSNIKELSDIEGYKTEFLNLFGFLVDGVDYLVDVNEVASENGVIMM